MNATAGEHFPSLGALVPHRPPLLFVEKILALSGTEACCEITAGNACFAHIDGAEICASVGLEYMAQTAAVLGGSLAAAQGKKPQGGMIASVRNYTISSPTFRRGLKLRAEAQILEAEAGTSIFETKLFRVDTDQLLQTARIVIVSTQDS